MPRTAKPVVTVDETLMLSKGMSPVRISQTPSNVNPRFLPAKLLVSAMRSSFLNRPIELNNLVPLPTLRPIQDDRDLAASGFHSDLALCQVQRSWRRSLSRKAVYRDARSQAGRGKKSAAILG